jgi:hypothetical protein
MLDVIESEGGAETVEIIIGIVVFVIFGLTVFGVVTNTAGKKAAKISNCFSDAGWLLEWHARTNSDTSKWTCTNTKYGEDPSTATYNGQS